MGMDSSSHVVAGGAFLFQFIFFSIFGFWWPVCGVACGGVRISKKPLAKSAPTAPSNYTSAGPLRLLMTRRA